MSIAFQSIPIENLTDADLDSLISAGAEESRTLDVKRDSYGLGDGDKRELARDITSFANTGGGDILVGVDERDGKLSGVPGISGNPDALIVRCQQIANSGITPRIPGIEWRAIPKVRYVSYQWANGPRRSADAVRWPQGVGL